MRAHPLGLMLGLAFSTFLTGCLLDAGAYKSEGNGGAAGAGAAGAGAGAAGASAGGATGGSGAPTTTTGGGPCKADSDCPTSPNLCLARKCDAGECTLVPDDKVLQPGNGNDCR